MNKYLKYPFVMVLIGIFVTVSGLMCSADDTCMFAVTADEVPPNIVILLDNGAEMQQVVWHPNYDNAVDYTPTPSGQAVNGVDDDGDGVVDEAEEDDVVRHKGGGSGFFNDNDYGIVDHGGIYYLVAIRDDLSLADYSTGIVANSSDAGAGTGTWTINGKTMTLPAEASAVLDAVGIKDNAGALRYSKNYLNWIFFTAAYDPATDGALPHKSRFYNAKAAILSVAKMASNRAFFGIYNFANESGASNVQPLGMVVDTVEPVPENNVLDPNFVNNVNNMGTNLYSPLAEGLATVGGYFNSSSSDTHVVNYYCQKSFVIVVSPGVPSADRVGANQYLPKILQDYDSDGTDADGYGNGAGTVQADSVSYPIPMNTMGATWLDDVAHYMYTHDMVSYQVGFQNVITYTVGFMGDFESNLYLINTSNNGNGNPNLYDTSHEDYGKYHFTAESPDELTAVLLDAVNTILTQNMTLIAPVVPVTKTMSSNNIYMALFKPSKSNFWEGNIVKYKIDENLEVVDANDNPATWPNGAIREDAVPLWSTKNWAKISNFSAGRTILTYLGGFRDLKTDPDNFFTAGNGLLDSTMLGNPTHTPAQIIDYIRGVDVFDEDSDGVTAENRLVVTGDVLHSQPLVVQYVYPDGSARSMVFFGSNDGMLHAVLDSTDSDFDAPGGEITHGTEEWAFISPEHLPRLKNIIEGAGHQYFVDSSPKVFRKDVNHNGILDADDRIIIVCGQRKGGSSYFALDVTNYQNPVLLWRLSPGDSFNPDVVVPELGQSWSEPQFGFVKTSDIDTVGTPVLFIGGGYKSDNTAGRTVLAIDVITGAVVRQFLNDGLDISAMNFSFASSVSAIDEDNNGFIDKVYIGDMGGQMWRIGQFESDPAGNPLAFPDSDENINNWDAHVIFIAPTFVLDSVTQTRKFHYPPSVTLEKGYDLVFMGTGDLEMACRPDTAPDRIYCVKDTHTAATVTETDLVDVTLATDATPDLNIAGDADNNSVIDMGWYIRLVDSSGAGIGEKVLSKGTVFYKTYYLTTFIPGDDPCAPGGDATIFALNYKTGAAVVSFGGSDLVRSKLIGGGIPSNPVPVITGHGQKLLISLGSTLPELGSESFEAGLMDIEPLAPEYNFYYLWWREL